MSDTSINDDLNMNGSNTPNPQLVSIINSNNLAMLGYGSKRINQWHLLVVVFVALKLTYHKLGFLIEKSRSSISTTRYLVDLELESKDTWLDFDIWA